MNDYQIENLVESLVADLRDIVHTDLRTMLVDVLHGTPEPDAGPEQPKPVAPLVQEIGKLVREIVREEFEAKETRLTSLQNDLTRIDQARRRMKAEAGYTDATTFDTVWRETLARAQRADTALDEMPPAPSSTEVAAAAAEAPAYCAQCGGIFTTTGTGCEVCGAPMHIQCYHERKGSGCKLCVA